MKKIAITTGDPDGVGLEVTLKALSLTRPIRGFCFYVFFSHDYLCDLRPDGYYYSFFKKILSSGWRVSLASSLEEALRSKENSNLFFIPSHFLAPNWVVESTYFCLKNKLDGICTAPLSKTLIQLSGLKDKGHTDILKRLAKKQDVQMAFLGSQFNVLLMTDHVPIKDVPTLLNQKKIRATLKNALVLNKLLTKNHSRKIGGKNKPIAVLGLNPHAGENGLLGVEEELIKKELSVFNNKKKKNIFLGPLVPDVAFKSDQWKKYSLYISCYHDQGLIPFKLVHGQSDGIQISIGLPFVRTSVDHGTAKDIFKKNKADASSMSLAIKVCIDLVRLKG